MLYFKKYASVVIFIVVLLFLFSATAFAADSDPKYVLFQRSDLKYIIVDYEQAVFDATQPLGDKLYNAAVEGIQDALSNHRKVYVETKGGTKIDYSKAVDDGLTFQQALSNSAYHVSAMPQPSYEMYMDGIRVALRAPIPLEFPEWMTVTEPWSEIANCFFVNVTIDETRLGEAYLGRTLDNIDAVTVKSIPAVRGGENNNIWRVKIIGTVQPNIKPADVRVMLDGSWLW
ncbi:MAG: hypothetical protein SCJ97_05050 [Bacillota bacterium]|nr:hypothetical protein [Bacillota bacterium]